MTSGRTAGLGDTTRQRETDGGKRGNRRDTKRKRAATSPRTTGDGRVGRLGPRLRGPSPPGPAFLARDRRRPDRTRRHRRRRAARRVRDPRLRHAARDGPHRAGVRHRAGWRAQRRVRGARGRAARHRRAQGRHRGGHAGAADRHRVQADRGHGRPDERRRPLQRPDVRRQRAHRVRRGAVRPGHLRRGPRGGRRRAGCGSRGGGARRRDRRVQRRRGVPADRAGHVRAARAARGADRPADRVPHVRRGVHPDRARDRGAADGVPAPLHPRRPDRHQHDHADPRVDDRARRRDRLLAVHRHAVPAAAARGALAGGRRRRGRRLRRPRRALRGPDRCDRRVRSRVLRARLRDQAGDRLGTRRAHDRPARELAPHRGAPPARSQDRPAEGAVPAGDRRLRGGAREDADRPLGPVRDAEGEGRLPRRPDRRARARGDLRARPARRRRPGHAADRADGSPGVRPPRGGLRGGLQRADPDRRRRER